MLNIKGNMKSHYKNKTKGRFEFQCRACNQHDETQPHILEECESIHLTEDTKVTTSDLFSENPANLKTVVGKIKNIMTKLESTD